MSYGFVKYVCPEHRTSAKGFRRYSRPRCPECSQLMHLVSSTTKIPPKKDDQGWRDLAFHVMARSFEYGLPGEKFMKIPDEVAAELYRRKVEQWSGIELLRSIKQRFSA